MCPSFETFSVQESCSGLDLLRLRAGLRLNSIGAPLSQDSLRPLILDFKGWQVVLEGTGSWERNNF